MPVFFWVCFHSLFWHLVALAMFLVPRWQSQGCCPKVTVLAQSHLPRPLFAWLFSGTLGAKPRCSGTPGSHGDMVVTTVPWGVSGLCGEHPWAVQGQGWAGQGVIAVALSEQWPGSCTPPKPYLPLHWNEKSLSWAGRGQEAGEIKAALYISSGCAKIW